MKCNVCAEEWVQLLAVNNWSGRLDLSVKILSCQSLYSSRSWTHSSIHTFHYKYITKLPSLTIIVIESHSPTCSLYGCLMWTRHIKHQQHTAGESDIWYRSRVVSTQPRSRWNTFFVVSQFEQTQALDTHMSTCRALYTTQHITSA